mmetsp:Transcript_89675/g.231455  ORF Transcript_89675/g.231455 Transcript_89675/m.231455 type:complete len:170 (-) Transcript_89675:2052-2561(-)
MNFAIAGHGASVTACARHSGAGGGKGPAAMSAAELSNSALPRASSSSWEPSSTTMPLSMTTILSLSLMVESRCAMTRAEPFRASLSSAVCTSFSFSLSSDAVASSSKMTSGSRTIARAIAMRCRCPPEKLEPPEDTIVMSLSGFSCKKSQAWASLQACSISLSVAPSMP